MRLTIFGSGYVGLVTGACFAEAGNNVLCVDVDAAQGRDAASAASRRSSSRGWTSCSRRNLAAGRLNFTTDAAEGVKHGLFQFIAVGTPPDEDGSADLKYVLAVAESIGRTCQRVPRRRHQVDRAGRHCRQGARRRSTATLQGARRAASSSTWSRIRNSSRKAPRSATS